ncbi:hypothetical protein LTS18_001869, partial [Coniosporium uncinatum]
MSPVVQKLETAAISSPAQHHHLQQSRSNSVSTAQSVSRTVSNAPPISPPSSPPSELPSQDFAPMAYNPAAPAAPEPIAHREKTPPPVDATHGTGLVAAAQYDHIPQPQLQHQGSYGMQQQQQQQQSYMPGLPQHQSAMPPPPPFTSTPGPHQFQRSTSSFLPPPPQSPHSLSFSPPPTQSPQDPNAHLYQQQQHPGLQRQATMPVSNPSQYQQQFSPQPTAQHANYAQQHQPHLASPVATPTTPSYHIGQAPQPSPG